jgi:2-amino-4-hydroxy-6-hydroxymethyldihydropteridine diphosphokinase
MREVVHVALGGNLDDPARHVAEALDALARLPRTRLAESSSLYRTAPVGKLDQPDFVNAVARLETELSADALLQHLFALEARHGRVRGEPNAARTLDLDLLLYGEQVIDTPTLKVPHPRMHERAFVLLPLSEISPAAIIPGRGKVSDLLAGVADQDVSRLTRMP